jgi:NTP pyrophosphatase (non-canonical NTP hydrolase)
MQIDDYAKQAMRTRGSYDSIDEQLKCAVFGITGEAGEVADAVKKMFYQGHDYDESALVHELGDLCWYIALMADAMDVSLTEIFASNITKLMLRYPDGYSDELSIKRTT